MKRLLQLAALLYPRAWRERYGAEFEALLEDTGASWSTLADVLQGAIVMQLTHWNVTRIVALSGAIGLAAGLAIAFRTQDRYLSVAVLTGHSQSQTAFNDSLWQAKQKALDPAALAEVIRKFDLYPEERKTKPLEKVAAEMTRSISLVPMIAAPYQSVQLSFSYPNRAMAQSLTRELANRLIADGASVVSMEMLNPASLPNSPSTDRRGIILAGLAIGLASGLVAVGIRRWPIVAIAGIAGLLLGGLASSLLPATYTSTALLHVTPPEEANQAWAFMQHSGSLRDFSGVSLSAEAPANTGSLYIRATARDSVQARVTVRSVVGEMLRRLNVNGARYGTPTISQFRILNGAATERPWLLRMALTFAGLVVGLMIGLWWQRFRPTIVFRGA